MAFRDCILSARDQGAVSEAEADELIARYEAHRKAHAGTANPRGPEGAAKDALAKELSDEAARRERLASLTAAKAEQIRDFLDHYRDEKGRPDVVEAVMGVLENRNNALIGTPSVVGRREALIGYAHHKLEEGLYAFRRSFGLGRRFNRARLENIVAEAFGEGTGDTAAKGFLTAWRSVADALVDRFNAAGGEIAKMADYFPQRHDARRLASAGPQAWADFTRAKLDIAKMTDPLTGGALTPGRLDEALKVVYRRIVTNGAIDREPAMARFGRGALANQRQEERFLQFKDARAWRDYAEAFGSTDIHAVMMDHIHGLAKDVAALEVLGPNPNAMVEWLKNIVDSEAAKAKVGDASLYRGLLSTSSMGAIHTPTGRIENLWNVVNGSTGVGNLNAADVMESVRNVTSAANLAGTALTAALGDPFQQRLARTFAGLPQMRFLAEIPKQMFLGSSKREIARAGIVFEDALDHLARDFKGLSWAARSKEATRYLPDRVFAWTGLTPWTRANRRTQAHGFMFEAGDRAGQTLTEIAKDGIEGERFARFLRGFGIDDATWDLVRSAKGMDHGEAGRLLRPIDVMHLTDPAGFEAGLRYSEAIHAFVEEAVPQNTARVRSAMQGGTKKGTFVGELVRQPTSYMAYPVTMLMSLARATAHEGGPLSKRGAWFLGSAVLGLTVGGALITQMRALRRGEDFEDPRSTAFWLKSFVAGGGSAFFGDWMFADYQRGAADTLARAAGPVGSLVGDVLATVNPAGFAADKDVNRAARAVKLGQRYVPGQNMWWLKPVTERAVWDQLQLIADPKAAQAWRRKERELMKQGRGQWWHHGEVMPERMPAF